MKKDRKDKRRTEATIARTITRRDATLQYERAEREQEHKRTAGRIYETVSIHSFNGSVCLDDFLVSSLRRRAKRMPKKATARG
jgi:hypothetical protein